MRVIALVFVVTWSASRLGERERDRSATSLALHQSLALNQSLTRHVSALNADVAAFLAREVAAHVAAIPALDPRPDRVLGGRDVAQWVGRIDTLEIVAFVAQNPDFRPAPLADLVSLYARAWVIPRTPKARADPFRCTWSARRTMRAPPRTSHSLGELL